MPKALHDTMRGNHGRFIKPSSDDWYTNDDRKDRIKAHCSSEVHKWCAEMESRVQEGRVEDEPKDQKAAELVVNAAVECFLDLDSSKKFVRINNMLEAEADHYPTKNDGRQMFFKIRQISFEKLTAITKTHFQKVKYIRLLLT